MNRGRKRQTHCKRGHDLSDPTYVYNGKHGRQCKACKSLWHSRAISSESRRLHIKNNKRKNYLYRTYKLSREDFSRLLEKQNNKCAICSEELSKKPCIDHNHLTGEIRAILCNSCNTAIGLFKENSSILKKAIKYLEEENARPSIGV